jgi:Uma2 family endonuclease
MDVLTQIFEPKRILVQAPVDVAPPDQERNFPEPDLAVLIQNKPDFDERHPRGDELLVVIEVAQTSLYRDVTTKRDLYARASVPEYWVVDLPGRRIVAYRALSHEAYTQILTFAEGESIALESEPGTPIAVAAVLPSL